MAFNSVKRADDLVVARNVLVSTYDKTGLAELVRGMAVACQASVSIRRAAPTTHSATPWPARAAQCHW